MNEIINELVDAIKADQRYISFQEAAKTLEEESIVQLLNVYQTVLNDFHYLRQFDSYIDIQQQKEKLKQIKKEIGENKTIQAYYQKYYDINALLEHVTALVFQNISESLDTTGMKL